MGKADDATQATSASDEVTMATTTASPPSRLRGYEQTWMAQTDNNQRLSENSLDASEGEERSARGVSSVMRGSFVRQRPESHGTDPPNHIDNIDNGINTNSNSKDYFDLMRVALDGEQPPAGSMRGKQNAALDTLDLEVAKVPNESATQNPPFPRENEDTKSRMSLSSQAQRQRQRRVMLVGSLALILLGVGLPVFFVVWDQMSSKDGNNNNSSNDIIMNQNNDTATSIDKGTTPPLTASNSTIDNINNNNHSLPTEAGTQAPNALTLISDEVFNDTSNAYSVPPPPETLNSTCSFSNLVTSSGYARCRRACDPAGCCWQDAVSSCDHDSRLSSECSIFAQYCVNLNVQEKQAQIEAACATFEDDSTDCRSVCAVATCCFTSATVHSTCEAIVTCGDYQACRVLYN